MVRLWSSYGRSCQNVARCTCSRSPRTALSLVVVLLGLSPSSWAHVCEVAIIGQHARLQGRALPIHSDCSSVLLPFRTQSFGRCPCISVMKCGTLTSIMSGLRYPMFCFCFCVCVRCGPPPVPCVMVEKLENRSKFICSWCCCDRENH